MNLKGEESLNELRNLKEVVRDFSVSFSNSKISIKNPAKVILHSN